VRIRYFNSPSGRNDFHAGCLSIHGLPNGINVQIAHIHAVEPGGARYDANMTDEARRSFPNLILLCKPCHDLVDKAAVEQYPPEVLERWKTEREAVGMAGLRALGGITEDRLQELITEAVAVQFGHDDADRRARLERDTAVALQDELFKFGRSFGQARHADEMTYNETGKWGSSLLPPGLSDELLRATIAVQQLRVRLTDKELRDEVARYVGTCTRAMIQNPKTADDATRRRNSRALAATATDLHGYINERLGQIIQGQ